jgi:predicted ester cyclase
MNTTEHAPDLEAQHLVDAWLRLWNGDYAGVEALIAPTFRLHAAMLDGGDGSTVDSPQALVSWITQTRAVVLDLVFVIQVGPIIDADRIALRWRAQGSYSGALPAAGAPAGTSVDFTGTDILRVADGRLAEYWVNSDTLRLVTQLQAIA